MTAGRDDDALTWDGDDDPTLDVGAASPPPADASVPAGWSAVGKGSEGVETAGQDAEPAPSEAETPEADQPAQRAPMGNAVLITLGVVGGIYLLWVIGWIVGGLRLEGTAQFLVSPVAFQAGLWLAAAAPVVWFATVFLLTRASRAWVRIVWLLAGVALLVPWPFIMTGAIGQ